MNLTAFLLALALGQAATGVIGKQDRPPAPTWPELKADPGLTILTAPAGSVWVLVDIGADLAPASDGATAAFSPAGAKPGRYRVMSIGKDGKDIGRVTIVVGDAPPLVDPDVPPKPVPVPIPLDPLVVKLLVAFKLDLRGAPAKALDLADLVALYQSAAELAGKADITTVAELIAKVREAAKMLILEGLTDCRKIIAEEMKLAFPYDAPLDDESRKKVKAMYLKIAEALKAVK